MALRKPCGRRRKLVNRKETDMAYQRFGNTSGVDDPADVGKGLTKGEKGDGRNKGKSSFLEIPADGGES